MFFLSLARAVRAHARLVLVLVVLITVVMASYIPSFRFESDLNKFLPEDPETQAHQRLQDYFGHDPSSYFINVVAKKGDNVLTPEALREQMMVVNTIRETPYLRRGEITGYISFAYLVDVLYRLNISEDLNTINPRWDASIMDATDDEVMRVLNMTLNILSQETLENYQLIWNFLEKFIPEAPPEIAVVLRSMMPEDLMLLKEFILSKDLRLPGMGGPSASSTLIVVWINGSTDPERRKEIAVDLRKRADALDLKIIELHETGADLLANDVDELTYRSNIIIGIGIVAIILLVLFLTFRDITYTLLPVLTMFLAIIWTIGTMIAVGIVFTAIDVAAIPLIVGLGVDDSVHLSKRYQEELRKGRSPGEALVVATHMIGTAIFLTSLTTVIAFISNMVSPVAPVRDFGLICATGIAYAFILTVTFQAALRIELDRGGAKILVAKEKGLNLESGMRRGGEIIMRQRTFVILIVLLLTGLSIWGATYVRTDFRIEDFLPEEWESVNTYSEISDAYNASSQSRVYFLIEGDIATVENLKALGRLVNNTIDDSLVVRVRASEVTGTNVTVVMVPRIYSVFTYIGMAVRSNITQGTGTLGQRYHFNEDGFPTAGCTDADVIGMFDYLLSNESLRYKVKTLLHRSDGRYDATAVRIFVDARSETARAEKVYSDMEKDMKDVEFSDAKVTKAGYVISTISTIHAIQLSQIESTVFAIILSAIILVILYRKVLVGGLSVLPVAISATWILGTMALVEYLHAEVWYGIPDVSLNVLTVMVTALTIGLGIDYSIHILQRYREELNSHSPEEAMLISITHSGTAILISMVTTVAGFMILLLSPMPITQHFGLITSTTMIYSFVLCIFFLPILLLKVRWKEGEREEKTVEYTGETVDVMIMEE